MAVENSEKSATEHAICAANTRMERSENFSPIIFPFHSTVLLSNSKFYLQSYILRDAKVAMSLQKDSSKMQFECFTG